MAYNLQSIQTGKRSLPPRMVLLGTAKVGKTTFASQAPSPIILPIKGEEGSDDMDIARFPIINTYEELQQALLSLSNEDHEYRTVILDSSSTLEPIIWDKVCREQGVKSIEKMGYGKGYVEALTYWREIMSAFDYLRNEKGMASIIIGHVKVKVFNDPLSDPYDTYQWDVHTRAVEALTRWADSVLFARFQSFANTEQDGDKKIRRATGTGVRKLYTQERPAHPGGGRGVFGRLPYEIDLDWNSLMTEVTNAG